MAVLQAVTIVGVDEAIVKREERSRRPALSERHRQRAASTKGASGSVGESGLVEVAYGEAAVPDGWPWQPLLQRSFRHKLTKLQGMCCSFGSPGWGAFNGPRRTGTTQRQKWEQATPVTRPTPAVVEDASRRKSRLK